MRFKQTKRIASCVDRLVGYIVSDNTPPPAHLKYGPLGCWQVWAPDDLRLFSASKDAIVEWRVGQQTRVRETYLRGNGR